MIPIIFIHYGDCGYLEYTFRLAKKFNPDADIYLLGDNDNAHYSSMGIIHEQYGKYQYGDLWEEFLRSFECITTFDDKEKFTFAFCRWFILYNFLREKKVPKCWLFDSDTMICCDLNQKDGLFSGTALSLTNHISCCTCLINDHAVTQKVAELIVDLYKNDKFLAKQKRIVADHKARGQAYSFCIMTALREYQKLYGPCGEATDIFHDDHGVCETFGPNINSDRADLLEDEPAWEMETETLGPGRPIKKIYFFDKVPFCNNLKLKKFVRMNTINVSWVSIEHIGNIFRQIVEED